MAQSFPHLTSVNYNASKRHVTTDRSPYFIPKGIVPPLLILDFNHCVARFQIPSSKLKEDSHRPFLPIRGRSGKVKGV